MVKLPPGLDWKLRFSIKTLLLFVFLLASAMGMWMRSAPWAPAESRDCAADASIGAKCWAPDNRRYLRREGSRRLVVQDNGGWGDNLYVFGPIDHSGGYRFVDDDTIEICDRGHLKIRVFKRRRPEWWWGMALVPEFWLTFLFAVAVPLSLKRDPGVASGNTLEEERPDSEDERADGEPQDERNDREAEGIRAVRLKTPDRNR